MGSTALFKFRENKIKYLKAVDGISFTIDRGETLGLAGESGCGKTTTAKILLGLYKPTQGKILCNAMDITNITKKELKTFRQNAQMIFQDPYESLNPRFKIKETLMEPLLIHKIGKTNKNRLEIISRILNDVGLSPARNYINRFPHELSGGQRQRISIARALIINPVFLVADEPVSMLDVSIRAGILNLLKELIVKNNLAGLYISHDISFIRYLCDRIAIMYLGRIVEIGRAEEVISKRYHPYTQVLFEAIPSPDPNHKINIGKIKGGVSDPIDLPEGCRFHNRCVRCMDICKKEMPQSIEVENNYWVECHLYNKN